MGTTRSAGWIGGTAVLIVAILLATYLLMYKPRAEATAETLAQVDETVLRNEDLQSEVDDLIAKAEHLQEYWSEIDEIAVQVPPTADMADFTQVVRETAALFTVTIVELNPGVPTLVTLPTPPVVVTEQPAPTAEDPAAGNSAVAQAEDTAGAAEDAAAAQDDTDGATVAPTTPTAPAQIEGFISIPVAIKVVGAYPNIVAFLDHLQRRDGRLFLASDVDATRQKAAAAAQGKPALADGDLELTISGYIYVLVDIPGVTPQKEPAEGAEEAEEPAEPVMPSSPANPFVPLVSSG